MVDGATKGGMTNAFKLKDGKEIPGVGPSAILQVILRVPTWDLFERFRTPLNLWNLLVKVFHYY